ncbi:MAG: 4-oxalocrotonate decarboxylase [Desulfomonile tiedjei]|uniref:4-oxalocrotonate decarboxylase n=1 Tax=Desulfomonile tiedjei TaxID=2358 RepID=A0A9D6Z3U5_9BACT|nr:4-oxalocrotonate decarboxylase [Desulfomonile tiedjei]
MKRFNALVVCLVTVPLFFACLSWAGEDEVIQSILEARASVKTFPLASTQLTDLSVDKAYGLQRELAKRIIAKGDKISGFKGGLTSEAGQKRFGVDRPLLGPLFKSGELGPDAVVDQKSFTKLFVETEIGYVLGEKISEPVKDVDSLKKKIKEVFPAIELPDLRFDDMKNLKGTDLIIDAVSSAKYIVGKKVPADQVDVTGGEVTLKLDGQEINKGKASDALGDQWKALLWLVNSAVQQGWVLEPGYVFITGAMGNMLPGKPGKYEGDWGKLGTISWTVK